MSNPTDHHTDKPKQKKKIHRHITKYLLERDTLFATLWVFLFIFILGSIPLNLGVINPIKLSLKDFDSNDMSYSKLGKAENTPPDKNIVVVNIGYLDREGLSVMIDKVASYKPKVMALDAYFTGPKDPYQDSLLSETFRKNKNLIAASILKLNGENGDTAKMEGTYINTANQYAHVNFFQDSISTFRYFEPFYEDYAHKRYKAFSTAVIEAFDSSAYHKLEKKGVSKVLINYSRRPSHYLTINFEDLMTYDESDSTIFKNKIVLFGYVNEDPNDIADKKFTPMNHRFYGKSIPDMNGIYIHANIISMALEKNYVKKLPSWANVLIAIIICWLHMSFFIHYYLESHIWFHLAAKIAQVLSAIFFVWLGIYLYDKYRLKVDLKLSLLVIVMAVDVIYFYEAWAVWMHKKFNYKTVFKPHHH